MKRALPILALALAVATPLAAQQGPPPGGGPPQAGAPQGGPPADKVLVDLLGFTEAQLEQLHQLAEARRSAAEALQRQIAEAEKALGTALEAASPDPATVGAALIRVHGLRKQHVTIDEAFRTGFAGLLTTEQKVKVDSIRDVSAAVQAGDALRRIGIL